MKKLLPILLLCCVSCIAFSQTGQWTWMSGDSIAQNNLSAYVNDPYTVYGTQGVPSVNNKPPARIDAAEWTDKEGNLWMYGGYVPVWDGFYNERYLGDLWKYNPLTNEWTYMGYSGPGGRRGALSWTDRDGNFWLMGGQSRERYGTVFNDLWKFNPSTLKWTQISGGLVYGGGMQGGLKTYIYPQYGTKGVPSTENVPTGYEAGSTFDPDLTWTDAQGKLWLLEKVLWRFDPSTLEWTWMSGDPHTQSSLVVRGTMGVPSVNNFPGRNGAAAWKDKDDMFWLYRRDELWRYNRFTNEWTWVSGSTVTNPTPVYGTKGEPSVNNTPGSVVDAQYWTDLSGNFWLLHGDDLWRYNPDTAEWTWVSGNKNYYGIYGSKGVASPANQPGLRTGGVNWTDHSNNLWLYGGHGSANSNYGYLKDMWKFTIDAPVPSITTAVPEANYFKGAMLTISYTTNGSFGAANTFNAELSDASGSFLKPVTIGSAKADASGTITATIPFTAATGTGYRIRVVATMPGITGTNNGTDITINDLPATSTGTAHTISTGAFVSSILYQGKEVSVSYTATGTYNAGTFFRAQLSDAAGSFDNPIFIGSVSATGSGTISATIPAATPAGTGYRVRVIAVAGNEPVIGSDNGSNLTVSSQPPYPAVSGSWTWMSGDNVTNQPGSYGTKGVPSTENKPGARKGAVSWKDVGGTLWLYGGYGYASNTTAGFLNDLWKYNPATGEWAWVSGDNVTNQAGVYGTKGISAPDAKPRARTGAAGWADKAGNLWLYGGNTNDPRSYFDGVGGEMNDLWKFDISKNEWTWVSGDSITADQAMRANNWDFHRGVYGTKGIPSVNNRPPAKTEALTWTDNDGNFWLYSGYAYYGFLSGHMTDLWKFNPVTAEWTFVTSNGAFSNADGQTRYGVKGVSSADNMPFGRQDAVGWVDKDNNLWLYGGYTIYNNVDNVFGLDFRRTLADLWKFNTTTGQWAWMGGEKYQPPVHPPTSVPVRGTKGVPSVDNHPGAARSGVGWTDDSGKFWLLNGDDLWKYDPLNDTWTWVSGDDNDYGVYGQKGVAANGNEPGARSEAVGWTGADGRLWLFGGQGFASTGTSGYLNDLWSFGFEREATTLTTSLLATTLCAGSKLTVSYTSNHSFNLGNSFAAQLSDANGSFANAVTIGYVSGTTPGMVEATIPANTPAGTGYRIRVVASSPAVIGTDNGSNLSLGVLPTITVSGGTTSTSGGLSYQYYEGSWSRLPDFGGLAAVASGTVNNITLAPRKRDEQFAMLFQGKISIPKAGRYYFETSSDDGSKLYIGGYSHYNTPVVDNDGMHGTETKGGWYTFPAAGQYDFAVSFFEQGGDQVLRVYWGSEDAGIAMHTPIPDEAFGAQASSSPLLTYKYYEGSFTRLPDFGGLTPLATGKTDKVDITPKKRDDNFAFLWEGKISIPKAGTYYFETASDDGSKLYIGNYGHYVTPVVDNDGQHAMQYRGGWYTFPAAGMYPIAITFFEAGGSEGIEVYWSSADAGIPTRTLIPGSAFREGGTGSNDCSAGITLTASEGEGYLWSTGDTTRSITVSAPGTYSVTVMQGGCTATSEPAVVTCMDNSMTQRGEEVNRSTAQAGAIASGKLTVKALPNPSPSHFTLQLSATKSSERITLRLLDGVGRLVETKILAAGATEQIGHTYRPGTYFVQVVQGAEKVTLKLVKTAAF